MNPASPPQTPPQRKESYTLLAQFTLNLIKSFVRSGYYAPDHPEAQKGLTHHHAEFKQLIMDRSELTYMVMMTGEDRAITIDGYDSAPLPLDRVIGQSAKDLFAPKFLEFLDRWNLVSFSLKADISPDEFHSFIVLMSQPPEVGRGTREAGDRLMRAFLDQHIIHVSTVFIDEMVGKERRLPWRLKLALSRLRRDLRMLPLYERATPEEIQRIKLQIIDDVIRPLRTLGLLKDFLVNCDLVAADITELDETQIHRQILCDLSVEMVVALAGDLVKDLERLGSLQAKIQTEGSSEEMDRRLNLLREVARRLFGTGSNLGDDILDLLESLLKHQVLALADIPPEISYALETRIQTDRFMAHEGEGVEDLRRIEPGEAGRQQAALVHRILPELLRRGQYRIVVKLLQAVNERRQKGAPSQVVDELAEQLAQSMASDDTLRHLLKDLHCHDKDRRNQLVEILVFIGNPAGSGLLEAYATSDDQSVRLSAFEAMKRIGVNALEPFLGRLDAIEHEGFLLSHILAALNDQRWASLAQPISRFLEHSDMHVRKAALRTLYKLQGPGAEGSLVHALRDRDVEVRQIAVQYLAHLKSRHPQALEFYARALNGDDPSTPPVNDAALIEICQALASFAPLSANERQKAETTLLTALRPMKEKGVLSRFKKPSHRHSERVRAAICEALGVIGTSAAVCALREVADTDVASVAEKAAAAADQIQACSAQKPPDAPTRRP